MPFSSPETSSAGIAAADRQRLLAIARRSIRSGLDLGHALAVHPAEYPSTLKATRASFVTLDRAGQLRGCIGHLEAIQPLVVDVAENAFSAAFRDPRFPPLQSQEADDLGIHIAILSHPTPLEFAHEEDLLQQLRPGVDGLILCDGADRGTFLPSVWESLPEPGDFLTQLKIKAGLPANHWSDRLQVQRYTTESFGDAP